MKDGRLIYFKSHLIKGNNLHKIIYEKEMLAILHALKQWRPYLMGRHFKVKPDHDSLEHFFGTNIIFERVVKMGHKDVGL